MNPNEVNSLKKKPESPSNLIENQLLDNPLFNSTITKSFMAESKISTAQKQRIIFTPKQLVFNLKNSQERQIIEVQNVTGQPLRLKIGRPKTRHFRIIYENMSEQNSILCPGLSKKIQVEYKRQQKSTSDEAKSRLTPNEQIFDIIKLQLQTKTYEVPLQAIKQTPKLEYEKLIDMKFVDMNKLMKIHRTIKNTSSETVKIKLLKESWDNMHIVPQETILKPNSEETLEFSTTPTIVGTYHHKILVQVNNVAIDPIEVIYSTYDYNYCIVDDNGGKISELDFGYMYFGSKKQVTLYAVNNTPNSVEMKGKVRIGYRNNPLEATFQSPQEFGQQCSATLIEIHPKSLRIEPFSKEKFILSSMGRITDEHLSKVIKYAKSQTSPSGIKTHKRMAQTIEKYKIEDEEFHECFISEFTVLNNQNLKDPIKTKVGSDKGRGQSLNSKSKDQYRNNEGIGRTSIVSNVVLTQLKVYYGLPTVKISPLEFDFGKVIINKPANQSFTLTNLNVELPVRVNFNKIIGVEIFPKQSVLKPNQTTEFQVYVTPINLGTINEVLRVTMEDNYVIECKIRYEVVSNRSLFKLSTPKQKVLHKSLHCDSFNGKQVINFNSTMEMLQKTCHNQVYSLSKPQIRPSHSSSLFNIRKNPSASIKQKERMSSANLNNLSKMYLNSSVDPAAYKALMGGNSPVCPNENSTTEIFDNGDNSTRKKKKINSAEIQQLEEQCQNSSTVKENRIALPQPKENLFVTKKIDKYEPYSQGHNTRKLLKSKTSKDFFSNVPKRQPRNRREAEEISMELKGESLKLIKINTKNISFGKMFVGSRMQKEFVVENDTEYSIQVKLKEGATETAIEKLENQMLAGTDYGEQIISSHSLATFGINLFAKECGKFEKAITYTINKVHEFQFLVEAEIELAALTINKNVLKMSYLDDLTEMFLKDSLMLKNDGNATTEFSISQQYDHFIIEPAKGIVEPGATIDVCLTYKCAVQTLINAGDSLPMSSNNKSQKLNANNNSNNLSISSTVNATQSNQGTSNSSMNQNFVDERISVDIKNGINMSIRVTFNPNITEPRCVVKESKINFGVTIVSKPKTKSFLLRNVSRTMTLFEIQNNECSEFLYFDLMKGKLPPESSKEITITYKSSIIQQVESFFKINIRGGLTINVPIVAESVAPNIRLEEEIYNFGDVCCGSSQVKAVHVVNESETVVELLLDLLDKRVHGTEYLYVSFMGQEHHAVFDETTGNQKPGILKNKLNDNHQTASSGFETEDEAIIDNACLQPQIHKLKVQPKSVYTFYIVFKPKLPGYYEFELPLYLENFIKNEALNKIVTCFATEPKFIVEPSVIRFKKKIINEKESTAFHPLIEFVTLKNPGDKELKWKIDYQNSSNSTSTNLLNTLPHGPGSIKSFNSIVPSNSSNNLSFNNTQPISSANTKYSQQPDTRFCFEIENKKGTVKPQSWECINIAFNPYEAGVYCYKLPLLIYNEERGLYQQEAEIRLEGEGQYPTLFFDRKEVIMPVVPLGVQSVAMFKLINEGYESISLKHRIQMYDLEGNCIIQGSNYYQNSHNNHSTIPEISVIYPEGIKMGINKKELYIIVKFICKKPISFTCKLQLYDNTKDSRVYSIPVSGTTDSSILTLFPYLSDPQNRYKLVPSNHVTPSNHIQKLKKEQSNYVINLESTDDRNAVDKFHNPYEKMSTAQFTIDCEIIRRWMNAFLKDERVGKFPEDVINCPQNLLKMLFKMTYRKEFETLAIVVNSESQQSNGQSTNMQSRDPPTQPQSPKNNPYFTSTMNNSNNIFAQFLSVPAHFGSKLQFYEYLIKLLKSMGCLLNHIRPYFLLKKEEFFSYIEKDPNWKNMAETYSKNYDCMHLEAWVVLFYQIVSNFWYNTAKLKSALSTNEKNHQSLQANNSSSNTSNSQVQSNIYSATEMAVLRWVKNIYEKYNQFQDTFFRFVSYGEDFRDSVGLIYSIYHHIINPQKKKKSLEGLTRKPLTPNEVTSNVRILYQLIEKIGLVPLIYEEEFPLIKQKETFLFMYQLFELLPQQLPKSDPIYFTCNLGEKCTKFIEIKNPSNKVVLYWVRLEGSRDFSHEEKQFIKLEPKSTYKFKVNFESRISKEEIAYLTFLNKLQSTDTSSMANTVTNPNANAAAGSTLVFELRSKIVGRKSIKKLEPIYCPIYESQMIRIPVENQFDDCEFANFEIHLFEEVLEGNSAETKPKLYPLRKIKHELTQSSEDDPVPQTDKKSLKSESESVKDKEKEDLKAKQSSSLKEELVNFFVDNETIKIKKNSSSYIELMFNPVLYHKIKCYLIFHDPLVGEFQYEIIGISEIPKVLHELKYPSVIYTSMKETLEVSIPLYNNFMIKSNLLMEQKLYSKNGRQKPLKKQDDLQDTYKIQVNMDQKILQYVTFPQEFVLKTSKKQSIDSMSKLKLECSFPVVVKDLALDFLMINQNKTDVRRIKLHLNLATKPIVSDIIIKTTARVPIIQPIPIQNTSAKDWRVKATLSEDEECQKLGYLSLKEGERVMSKDFIVKRANVGNVSQVPTSSNLLINSSSCSNNTTNTQILTLVFSPKWVCKISGKLAIQNITTNEQLIYHIKAFAEEPVSEGHIYFKLKTSTEETKKITIKNPYNEALTFRIESDIEEMIKLPQYIYLDAHGEASINATMEALIPSKNIGYIKLTDERSRFFWYTLTIESYDDSQPEKILEITSEVGQSVEKSLDIYNPTNQKLRFAITYPENAFVKGDSYVDVDPHANSQAIVTFCPQVAFTSKSQIRISNKLAGSILYKLSLTAIEPIKKTCQTLSAEVNKSTFTSFKITNSLKNPIRIKCELSESRYFELQYNEVIPAKTDAEVKVQFRPLEEGKYPCVLKIFGEQLQTKCYEIEGIGLKPFTVEKIQMKTSCGSPCLEIIKFKNPNPKKIKEKVQIQIEDKEFNHNCFRVISQKGQQQTWQTSVAEVLAVPIQFNPVEKGYFQSMLYIRCAHYEWKYMLKGTTNTKTSSEVQQKIEGECRKQVIKIMKIPIPNYLRKQENFTTSMLDKVQIECDESKTASKIKSWMQIKIQTPLELEEKTPLEEEEITLMCKFTPLQPLEEIISFNISHAKSEGSIRLSHKVKLSIKPCDPEQTITIDVSSIKKYKFDINLDEIGVIAKKGQPVNCTMLKKQLVECKFKPQNSQSSQNNSVNSSMKNLGNVRNSLQSSSIVEVSFSPNNLVFNSTKGKNQYSDVLMVFTEKNFWNCEIIFKLSNNAKKP